jgi:hypothetical protein
METINVTIEVTQVKQPANRRHPSRVAFEAKVSEGPEWIRHHAETGYATEGAAYGWFADRLVMLYSHRANLHFKCA